MACSPVTLGSNPAAQMHAEEMVEYDYFSRWWVDGRSTYMVYSATGGSSYARESIVWTGWREEDWLAANCAVTTGALRSIKSAGGRSRKPTPIECPRNERISSMKGMGRSTWGLRSTTGGSCIVQHFEGGEIEADAPPRLSSDGALSTFGLESQCAPMLKSQSSSVSVYYDPLPTSQESLRASITWSITAPEKDFPSTVAARQ